MFDIFGEFGSAEEINATAAGLKEEGDIENLGVLANENGLDPDDVEMYLAGETEELTDVLGAALGKLAIEKKEANNILIDDMVDYLSANCDDESLARGVRKKGKRTIEAAKKIIREVKKNKLNIEGEGALCYLGPMKGYQLIKDYYMEG